MGSCKGQSCSTAGCTSAIKALQAYLKCFFNFVSERFFDATSRFSRIDVDETGVVVNSRASMLEDYEIFNNTEEVLYVKFYDLAELATISDVPKLRILVPPMSGANLGLLKIKFSTGIALRATKGIADGNTTSPDADTLIVNLGYRSL